MIQFLRPFAVAAVLATALAAQSTGVSSSQPSGAPPDPQTMIQMRVNQLATLLNLTDS